MPLGILRLHRSGKPRGIYANDIPQIHPKFPPNRLVCMQMTPKTMALVQWHRKHEEEALLLLILARRLRAKRKRKKSLWFTVQPLGPSAPGVKARLHRRAVTASGSGERWCRSVFCIYTGAVNRSEYLCKWHSPNTLEQLTFP